MSISKFVVAGFLFISILCTPVFPGVVITDMNQQGFFTVDYSGCTLEQVLTDANTQLGLSSFAVLNKYSNAPNLNNKISGINSCTTCFLSYAAGSYSMDTEEIDKVQVLMPRTTDNGIALSSALRSACQASVTLFVTSLTPEQLAIHKAKDGIPWSELTDQQKGYLKYCATAWDNQEQFPEPELSKRLEQSKAIVSIHPAFDIVYPRTLEDGKVINSNTSYTADTNASMELWKQWAPGQHEQSKMAAEASRAKSDNIPGDTSECKLHGIYKVSDLLKMLEKNTGVSITTDDATASLRTVAYCTITHAGLARAVAASAGKDWTKTDNSWVLGVSPERKRLIDAYDSKASSEYLKTYLSAKPKLREIMKTRTLKVVADPHWTTITDDMLSFKPITLNDLTGEQRTDVRNYCTKYASYVNGLATALDSAKLRWSPKMMLYLATDNSILYAQWLNCEISPGDPE